jgi:hypothetical protein
MDAISERLEKTRNELSKHMATVTLLRRQLAGISSYIADEGRPDRRQGGPPSDVGPDPHGPQQP